MRKFEVNQTAHTPYFLIDFDNGYIMYKGRFIPDMDPFDFMRPIHDAIKDYAAFPREITTLDVYYEYVNTGNLHTLLEMFKMFKSVADQGHELICFWHFDDENDDVTFCFV